MKLNDQDRAMGLILTTCKCCGHTYKAHPAMNACAYSLRPGYGCQKCQGVAPEPQQQAGNVLKFPG